jgi:hypothetical protein
MQFWMPRWGALKPAPPSVIIEDVLRQLLIETGVTGTRVFLMRAPQVAAEQMRTPYMVFFLVGPTPLHSITAPLAVLDREYHISIFDPSQSRALGMADELRRQIDGIRGDYMGLRLGGVFYRSQTWSYESGPEVFQVIQTYRILFTVLDSFHTMTLNPRIYRKPIGVKRNERSTRSTRNTNPV